MSPRYRSLVRRCIAFVLMVTIVVRSPLTPAPLSPSTVHADTIVLCGPNDPGTSFAIVQNCALGDNFHNAVEPPIIDDILQTYDLPSTDDGRLLSWQRDVVRAAVFAKVVSIINTPASSRTIDEQTAVNDLASLVQARRVQAAEDAKQEYINWSNNICGYNPPGPFAGSYDVTGYCNGTQVGSGPPPPPSLQDFENYGAYLANSDMYANPGLSGISQRAALALGLLGGAAAAAAAGIGLSFAEIPSTLIKAVYPFFYVTTGGYEGAGVLFGGPLAILIGAVTTIVIGSIEISQIEQLPGQLDQGITTAQAPIDLTALVQSKEGLQEVYGAFIRTTMPGYGSSNGIGTADFQPSAPAPAYTLADRKFAVSPPTGPAVQTGQLTYLDWAGKQQTAWLDGGWFVVEDSSQNLRLSLSIEVRGPSFNYTVSRDGDDFSYVGQNGDTGLGQSPTGFPYKTWTGEVDEAVLAPPDGTPPWIDTAAVTSDGAGDVVPYDFGTTATAPVTLTFTCNDSDGPGDVASCPAPLTFTGPISTTVQVQASDWSGNVEKNAFPVIVRPAGYNLPTISAGATTADGKPYVAGTWTNQPVAVHYTCDDPVSGILSCPNDQVFSDQGMFDAGGQVVANSYFINSTAFGPIKIDKTPPSIELASATTADGKPYVADTWANQPVTLSYTCGDDLSGIAAGGCPADQTYSDFVTVGAAGTATDNAGNTAVATFGTIRIDTTAPTVLCQSANFVYGQANAMVSATVSDLTSGPQGGQPGGTTTISATASTSTVGPSTVSLTGQDNAGNSTTVSCPFSVSQAQTSTSLSSSVNPSVFGQAVTFTAMVSVQSPGGGMPTTPVVFKDNGVVIGTATLGATGNPANVATFTTGSLSLGSHPITAVYSGDPNFQGSTSAVIQYVNTNLSSYPKLPGGTYNLSNTNLSGAYLAGTDLTGANLATSNLKGATFTNTNLSGANLSNSNFKGANFTNANLSGVNLANSNLIGATGLKTATLTNVIWSKTACPDGTLSNKDGGTCVGHL